MAQFVKAGVKVNRGLYHKYTDFSNEKSLEFINLLNSSITIEGIQASTPSLLVAPELYVKYDWKNSLFTELSIQYSASEISYGSETTHRYIDNLNNRIEISENRELISDISYFIPSIKLGYRFLKTKLIRPVIYAGLDVPLKLTFHIDPASVVLTEKSTEIESILNTVCPYMMTWKIGTELHIYNFILGVACRNSFMQIDKSEDPFYNSFRSMQIYIGLNLFNISSSLTQNE